MSESRTHLRCIDALVRHVQSRYAGRTDLVLYSDAPGTETERKPPSVGGFRPDLFATAWKDDSFVIGEAKTVRDLETEHSAAQLRAFITELSWRPRGTLIVCVPFGGLGTARSLIDVIAPNDDGLRARISCVAAEAILHTAGVTL